MSDIVKNAMDNVHTMTVLLSDVISSMEDSDHGYVSPDIYVKIKNYFGETNYPENMQKQIDTWRELYGEDSIPLS